MALLTWTEAIIPPEGDIYATPEAAKAAVESWVSGLAKGKGWTAEHYGQLHAALLRSWDDAMTWGLQLLGGHRAATAILEASEECFKAALAEAPEAFPGLADLLGGVEQRAGQATREAPREESITGQAVDAAGASLEDVAHPWKRRPGLMVGLAVAAVVLVVLAIAYMKPASRRRQY